MMILLPPIATFLCVCCWAAMPVLADLDLCRALSDMTGVNRDFMQQLNYGFTVDNEYFCGPDAPAQFQCSCGSAGVCQEQLDPWGRNVGVCGCCPNWVWAVLAVFSILFIGSLSLVFYACCCRGRWWFDGYPEPIQPILPRRGPPVVVPAGMPLPQTLFRGYRISDFVSGDAVTPATSGAAVNLGSPASTPVNTAIATSAPSASTRRRNRATSESTVATSTSPNQPVASSGNSAAQQQAISASHLELVVPPERAPRPGSSPSDARRLGATRSAASAAAGTVTPSTSREASHPFPVATSAPPQAPIDLSLL